MELLLKGTSLPLPQRNLQVATVSLVLATAHMLMNDLAALRNGGFFQVRCIGHALPEPASVLA